MTTTLRLIALLVLTLSLQLAGAARAMPLLHAQPVEMMVICAEGGAATIYLDRNGVPTTPVDTCATCPECLSINALDLDHPHPVPTRTTAMADGASLTVLPIFSKQRHLRPETRGPPPVVPGKCDLALAAAHGAAAIQQVSGACQPDGRPHTKART